MNIYNKLLAYYYEFRLEHELNKTCHATMKAVKINKKFLKAVHNIHCLES